MKLNARLIVFCLLTFFQIAVVLTLSGVGNSYVKNKLSVLITNQIKNDNAAFASHLESSIVKMKLYDLRIGADDWNVLQEIVEHTKIPNSGFLCVMDLDTNHPICHPGFKSHPELCEQEIPVWDNLIHSGNMMSFDEKNVVRAGKFEFNDEMYWVAGRSLGEFHVAILAFQNQKDIETAIANAAFPITKLFLGVCLLGLFMTTLFGLFVIWRSENRIARANDEIERLRAPDPRIRSRAFADVTNEDPKLVGTSQ